MEAESFRLRTTVSREMSEPERRSARPVARPQRLEYPGHAAPAPRERGRPVRLLPGMARPAADDGSQTVMPLRWPRLASCPL